MISNIDYKKADAMLQGRNLQGKKIDNNTYLKRRDQSIAVMLHETDIATYYPSGSVMLNSGNWRTRTTADRLRRLGFRVYASKGVWFIDGYKFEDGITISKRGKVSGMGKVNEKLDKAIKKQVKEYANLCADSLPLEQPSSGDCWFCYFQWNTSDSSHLDSHMTENYVVPSMIFNILKTRGSKASLWGSFDKENGSAFIDHAKDMVNRTVRRYILQAKGYQV